MISVQLALLFFVAPVGEAGHVPGPKLVTRRWAPEGLVSVPCVSGVGREAHRVTSLPGLPESFRNEQFAGEVCVDAAHGGRIFYWAILHEDGLAADVPLLFWLNGGPGCSSLDGLFSEGGPFRITHDLDLEINPHAWTKQVHMVFVDQPVGTGLSWVEDPAGYCRSQADVNLGFFNFMKEFLSIHPSFRSARTYLAGESYAGHYIPSLMAHMALPEQQAILPFDIHGALIGNGWTDPKVQFGSYAEFAKSVGIIGEEQAAEMRETYAQCLETYRATGGPTAQNFGEYSNCESLLDYVLDASGTEATGLVNMYDIREYYPDAGASLWPPHVFRTGRYTKRPGVLEAIHASGIPYDWTECSDSVSDALHGDGAGAARYHLPGLLANGAHLLFYNGQFDLICNALGTQQFLREMIWPHESAWRAAAHTYWIADGKPAGYGKTFGNLTFVTVNDASHMAPMDQPAATEEMLRRFLAGLAFNDPGSLSVAVVAVRPGGAATATYTSADRALGTVLATPLVALLAGAIGLLVRLGLGRTRSLKENGYAQLA